MNWNNKNELKNIFLNKKWTAEKKWSISHTSKFIVWWRVGNGRHTNSTKSLWNFFLLRGLQETYNIVEGCHCGVTVKAFVCGIVVRDFELQSRYYVYFRTNTIVKGMKPVILAFMGWIVPLLSF